MGADNMQDQCAGQPESSGSAAAVCLLTPWALAWAVPVGVLYLVETFVFKALQLARAIEKPTVVEFLQVWSADAALAVGLTVLLALLLSVLGRRWRVVPAVPVYLFWAWALMIAVAGYGYFAATGACLSWGVIKYLFSNFAEKSNVAASETPIWRLVLLGLQPALVLGCVLLPLVSFVRRWLTGLRSCLLTTRKAAPAYVICGLVVAGLALVPAPDGPAATISRPLGVEILEECVREEFLPDAEVVVLESERLDGSIEFAEPTGARGMNVVLFVFESLRAKSADPYVPSLGTTPFLAGMAARGATVENNYTVVPHTTKALVSIHCGFYPALLSSPKEASPGILPRRCLAHILRRFGYKTAFFQCAGNFEKRDLLVGNMGYETYKGVNDMPNEGFEDTCYFGKEERIMLRPSMEWVDSVKGGPFLLSYLTLSTHHNYVSPQSFPRVEYGVEDHDLNNYMNAIRYTDEFLKEVYQELEVRGLVENTLFIVVGDHGEAFEEHGRRQHDHVLWDEGVKAAAVYYAPGIFDPGSTIPGPNSILDIVPTVCDALGLELEKGRFVGRSLLDEPQLDRKLFLSCLYKRECLALVEGNTKYIHFFGKRPMEVFDLRADPEERRNLAHSGVHTAELLREKKDQMIRWERTVNKQYEDWAENLKNKAVATEQPDVGSALKASFDGKIELIGYEVDRTQLTAGRDVTLKYVFKCLEATEKSWKFFVHLKHEKGQFHNADHAPAGGSYPVAKWQPGEYIIDEHTVRIPSRWPKGKARVMIGFWDKKSKERLPVSSADGEVDGDRVVVTTLDVRPTARARSMTLKERRKKISQWIGFEKPEMRTDMNVLFGNKVELVGLDLIKMDAKQSGTVRMNYAFHALEKVPSNWKLIVELVRKDKKKISGDHTPIGGLYPPGDWRVKEYVVDNHHLLIEYPKHKAGTYSVYLGFKAGSKPVPAAGKGEFDSEGRVRIGTVVVEAFKP